MDNNSMPSAGILPTWAPRIKKRKLRSLYENDAQGILDFELLDEVGWSLYFRCKSFLQAVQALHGTATCPVCDALIPHQHQPEEILHCPACGWENTWKAYHQTIQHKQLSGSEEVVALFKDYVDHFQRAKDPKEKMLLIDVLIHGWHWNLIRHMGEAKISTRAVCVNLIEGSLHEVVEFLNQLSYGPGSSPGVLDRHQEWQEKVKYASKLFS